MIRDLTGMRVALVGGAGFIGHNLALGLHERGADVHVIDGLQVNNLLAFQSTDQHLVNRELYLDIIRQRMDLLRENDIPLYVQDARDYHALGRLLNHEIEPQVLVHLAAVSHAGRSNKDPYSTFDHSFRTLENALDCARGRMEQFIFLSSSMVYGNFGESGEVVEDQRLDPMGIYGALKLGGEKLVIAYNQVFDLPYTIIRPSALYGPRCVSRRVGQVFIENAFAGEALRIEGDGSDHLDFTYIDDLVQGIIRAVGNPAAHNETFNLTYGESRSIKDLAAIVQEHFPEVELEVTPRDRLMPVRGTLRVDKARDLLGYDPQFPLERGLERYIEWYRALYGGPAATVGSSA